MLSRNGEEISVPARAFDLLLLLVRRHGQLVTKTEMLDAVWANSFVEESNLTVAISTLRRALGEDPHDRKYIQTVSGRGYRFIGHPVLDVPLSEGDLEVVSGEEPLEKASLTAIGVGEATGAPIDPSAEVTAPAQPAWRRRSFVLSAVILLAILGIFVLARWFLAKPAAGIRSIAILPMTGTGADDYVLLGMTDALIGRVGGTIEVRPTSSVLKYSSAQVSPADVGREQNADAVALSTMSHEAGQTTIHLRLFRTSDARLLWDKSFSDPGRNMSRLQDVAANSLSTELAKMSEPRRGVAAKAAPRPPVNDEAYLLYLKGRYFWNRRTEQGLRQSIEYFRQSIAVDPNYALAYAGLADSYALLASFSVETGRTANPDARAAALSAIQLDPTLAEPHASLGMIYFFTDWNGPAAETEFERAIALNPNYATAHHWYALDLAAMGRFPEALYEIHRAQALDPLSLIIGTNVGWIEYLNHHYDGALAEYRKVLEMDPSFVRALTRKGIAEIRKGDFSAAVVDLTSASKLSGDPYVLALLGQAKASSGSAIEAERILKQLQDRSTSKYVPPFTLALVDLGLKRNGAAIEELDRAVQDRSTSMVYAKIDPSLDELRGDPAFQKVIANMHF